jgi:hypothetical protein
MEGKKICLACGIHSYPIFLFFTRLTSVYCEEYVYLLLLFSLALQLSAGYGLLVSRGFLITQNDAPQLVRLLWTSDQLVAETST